MESTSSFTYLRSKLTEWKANDLLHPAAELTWERFQEIAITTILPVLAELQAVLESEGLEVSITELEEETRSLGLYVNDYDIGLFFSPAEEAMTLRFAARRLTSEELGYEARIPYRNLHTKSLRALVEEALLRLLGPRRSNS